MTTPPKAGDIAANQTVDGEPDVGTSTKVAEPTDADPTEVGSPGGRHRRRGRRQTDLGHGISRDRRPQMRLLASSLIGTACLMLALYLQPSERSPFAAPSGTVGWLAFIAGIVGIWLVPGSWLSAVMMRTGVGPVPRLATRIGSTLAWYALVGPIIHLSGQGAVSYARRRCRCDGGSHSRHLSGRGGGFNRVVPANPALRFLFAALAGGICAQTVIWLSSRLFTDGVNYEHIRRLDWLIVLACALLTAIGAQTPVPTCPWCATAPANPDRPRISSGGRGHRRGAGRDRQQVVAGAANAIRHGGRAGPSAAESPTWHWP